MASTGQGHYRRGDDGDRGREAAQGRLSLEGQTEIETVLRQLVARG
jgi:hypothetical protein